MENQPKDQDSLRTVQRAIDILSCFTLEQPELTLTEIAKQIDLAKSTTTRLLSTLEKNNFVFKNPNTLKYKLGHRLYYLGNIVGKTMKIKEIAKPVMDELRDETKETVTLYVLENNYRICLDQSEGVQSIRHSVKIGGKLSLVYGSGGKVILAHQSDEFIRDLLASSNYQGDVERYYNEINQIKREKFSISIDETEVGTSGVSAPIFDMNGEVKASLTVSGPSIRFTEESVKQLKSPVIQAALKISQLIGYTE